MCFERSTNLTRLCPQNKLHVIIAHSYKDMGQLLAAVSFIMVFHMVLITKTISSDLKLWIHYQNRVLQTTSERGRTYKAHKEP